MELNKVLRQTVKELLVESFDLPFNWNWESPNEATFEVDNREYFVLFLYLNDISGEIPEFSNYDLSFSGWDVSFGVKNYDYDNEDFSYNFSIETKDYKAIRILSTVVSAINSFVERMEPNLLIINVDNDTNLNRFTVYKKMLNRYLPPDFNFVQTRDNKFNYDQLLIYHDIYQETMENILGVA